MTESSVLIAAKLKSSQPLRSDTFRGRYHPSAACPKSTAEYPVVRPALRQAHRQVSAELPWIALLPRTPAKPETLKYATTKYDDCASRTDAVATRVLPPLLAGNLPGADA